MRHRSLSAALLAGLLSFGLAPAAGADLTVTGRVSDTVSGDPVPGCLIKVLLDSRPSTQTPAASGADGSFSIDLRALFGAAASSGHSLVIEFQKTGFLAARRLVSLPADGTPLRPLDVKLAATAGATALEPWLRHQLEGHRSGSGRTLYLFRYTVPAGGATAPDTLTWMLSWNLKLAINGQIQAVCDSLQQRLPPVDVDTLVCPVNTANSERVLAIGRYLNALAMICGAAVPAEPAPATMTLTSEFQTVRPMPPYSPFSTALGNSLVGSLFDAPEVNRQLGPDWRSLGVLAVIERELDDARASGSSEKKCDLHRMVVAQLSTMRPNRSPAGDAVIRQLQLISQEVASSCP